MTLYERKVKKILLSLEKFALKGKDNYIEYHKYVDELVEKGDYNILIEVLYTYYFFEPGPSRSVDELKKAAWKEICFQTSAPFLKKLKKVYDQKKVYQNSFDIYSTNLKNINLVLGNPLTSTFSQSTFTSSISLFKSESNVLLRVDYPYLHSINIYKADWISENGIEEPINESEIQNIRVEPPIKSFEPSQNFLTDISLDVINSYWINTEEREVILQDFNSNSSFKTSSLGTASIKWEKNLLSTGYILNISTFSSLENTLPDDFEFGSFTSSNAGTYSFVIWNTDDRSTSYILNISTYSNFEKSVIDYDNKLYGPTTSLPYYLVAEPKAYAYILGLSASTKYYWKLQKVGSGYTNIVYPTVSQTDYFIGATQNTLNLSGLSQSTDYYFSIKTLFNFTQSFTSNLSGVASINWEFDSKVSGYSINVSTYSTFENSQNYRLGTQSQLNYSITGNTASLTLIGLSNSTNYYCSIRKVMGRYANLNYKLQLTQNTYLGSIVEREIFTPDAKYYVLNRRYANVIAARKTYLEVYKYGYATASIFAYDNPVYSEEQNLIIRYTQAVDFLNF